MSRLKVKQPAAGTQTGADGSPITTVKASDKIDVEELDQISVAITGITTGTVQVQSSMDGTSWVNEGAAFTADGVRDVSGVRKFVRANVTVATSVAVLIKAAGRIADQYS
jgi:hypothetical protein